jgi:hypothetical protein
MVTDVANVSPSTKEEDNVSLTSTEILSSSSLFYVLQRMFVTSHGTTVADELASIARSLETIAINSKKRRTTRKTTG